MTNFILFEDSQNIPFSHVQWKFTARLFGKDENNVHVGFNSNIIKIQIFLYVIDCAATFTKYGKRPKNWLTEIILDQNDLSSRIDIWNHEEQTGEISEIK